MNKEKYFIDLSKLSKKQIKSLPQIFEKAGHKILSETISDLISGKITDGFKFLFYSPSGWNQNDYPLNGRTELTYSEFIKLFEVDTCPKCRTKDFENCHSIKCPMRKEELFEGGEGENNGWIKIESEADLPKEDINCWWMDKKDGMILGKFLIENNNGDIDFILENATHYQPITKPEPPKF